jgi:hypothetical protein
MDSRPPRPNGRKIRDSRRKALTVHFGAMVIGLVTLAVLNRALTPGSLWVQWPALFWSALFALHLVRFNRGTMATMGRTPPNP